MLATAIDDASNPFISDSAANAVEDGVNNEKQTLRFHNSYGEDKYFLLELPEEAVAALEQQESSEDGIDLSGYNEDGADVTELRIRGLRDDEAVLCMRNKSWVLRHVDTSNQTLLCRNLRLPDSPETMRSGYADILANIGTYLEVGPLAGASAAQRLEEIARERCRITRDNLKKPPPGVSIAELRRTIQVSDGELMQFLLKRAFIGRDIGGMWLPSLTNVDITLARNAAVSLYILDEDLLEQCLKMFLFALVSTNDSTLDIRSMDRDHCLKIIAAANGVSESYLDEEGEDVPDFIARSLLEQFAKKVVEPVAISGDTQDSVSPTASNGKCKYSLDFDASMRYIGERILARNCGEVSLSDLGMTPLKTISKKELYEEWEKALPDPIFGFKIHMKLLAGLYIQDASETMVAYFPSHRLSLDPKKRFEQLYKVQPKWDYNDIVEFLSDLAEDSKMRDALMLKFSRLSTVKERKYVSSRFTFFSGGTKRSAPQ